MNIHYPLNPTTGVEDQTQLPWNNGFPQTGQEGSYPPYQAVVFSMEELVNLIVAAGLTPTDGDLTQVTQAVRALAKVYGAASQKGLGLDSSNNLGLNLDNLPVETTFNDADKLPGYTEEAEDGLTAGLPFAATFGAFAAYVLGKAPAPPSQTSLWHEGIIAGAAAAMTVALTPPATADAYGINMRLTVNSFTDAANPTLDFGFGPKPLVFNVNGAALAGGEFLQNEAFTVDIFYDGTRARVMNIAPTAATTSQSFVGWKVIAASETYVPDPGCTIVDVIGLWGPGGNGGTDAGAGGGGGGGGGFAAGSYPVTAGQGYAVVLPAAGSQGTASFGSFCSATGGGNGNGASPGGGGQGYGQATFAGLAGQAPNTVSSLYFPGPGGSAFQSAAPSSSGPVYNGSLPGAGGTGGNSRISAASGGTGGPSLLILRQRSTG